MYQLPTKGNHIESAQLVDLSARRNDVPILRYAVAWQKDRAKSMLPKDTEGTTKYMRPNNDPTTESIFNYEHRVQLENSFIMALLVDRGRNGHGCLGLGVQVVAHFHEGTKTFTKHS